MVQGLSQQQARSLVVGGIVAHLEGRLDVATWRGVFPPEIDAQLARAVSALEAPEGLSVVVSSGGAMVPLRETLAALQPLPDAGARFEIIVALHGDALDARDPPVGDGEPGVRVIRSEEGGEAAALAAASDAATRRYLLFLRAGALPTAGFLAGMLRACARDVIAFGRLSSPTAAGDPESVLLDGCFAERDELPPEDAAKLRFLFASPWGKAIPRIFAHVVRFDDSLGPLAATAFWAEVVTIFHPRLKAAHASVRTLSPPSPSPTGVNVRDDLLRLLRIVATLDGMSHPYAEALARDVGIAVRDRLWRCPELAAEAFLAAKSQQLQPEAIDTCFRGMPLTNGVADGADEPSISVVIPVFNAEKTIDACLQSVAAQTLKNIEILCVDDCSRDGSFDRLLKHAAHDRRIRVLGHGKNRGPGGARNSALLASRGQYVAFVDSDDRAVPEFLETLWAGTENGHFDIVVCGSVVTDEAGETLYRIDTDVKRIDPLSRSANRLTTLGPSLWNKLWRRSLFLGPPPILFPEDIYFQDAATVPRLMRRVSSINRIGTPLYHYVTRKGSITRSFGPKSLVSYLTMFDTIKDDVLAHGDYMVVKDSFETWIAGHFAYHARSINGLEVDPDQRRRYARHLELVQRGYLAFDDRIRKEIDAEYASLLQKHHGRG